jgi:sugar/nucleoside kinase (ribokinase family)
VNTPELRRQCAEKLGAAIHQVTDLRAFLGLDGFVDEIIHVVDKRDDAESFHRLATIAEFAERIAGAAGKSTNIELVTQRTKLGGNGPIMANALAQFGMKVTYLGALGYPVLHPVFDSFAQRAEVYSIAEPGSTDALEFEDGKLLFGKSFHLKDVNWANIQERFGVERLAEKLGSAHLVGFVNWTMIPCMSELWETIHREVCPFLTTERRTLFFDLADPEKRSAKDITRALELMLEFQKYFDVILGLNEKEAYEIGEVIGLVPNDRSPDCLARLALEMNGRLPLSTLVVHPVAFALAVSEGQVALVHGPHVSQPLITTGAGDHFNAGFCLGKLLGLGNALSLLTGVTASGYYVRTGQSPSLPELCKMLRDWPEKLS